MTTIQHEAWIDAPPKRVYDLLSTADGISSWWDQQTERHTHDGVVFDHSPGPEHGTVSFLVLESTPNERIRWRVISEHPDNVPASEWTGTEIDFRIGPRSSSDVASDTWASQIPLQSVVRFTHSGWKDGAKYLPFCSFAWAHVLGQLAAKSAESA